MTSRTLPLFAAAALFAVACGPPRIRIERTQPARMQLSDDRRLSIKVVAAPAQPGAQDSGSAALGTVLSAAGGQFMPRELTAIPLQAAMDQQLRRTRFAVVDSTPANTLVKVTPVDWKYKGPVMFNRNSTGEGTLRIRVELRDAKDPEGQPFFTETYWATRSDNTEPETLLRAANGVTAAFIEDLTPSRVWSKVEMDDGDPAVKSGLELCRDGNFEAAHAAFSDVVARNPNSAPALYNLAVLDEARGDYGRAEQNLLQATRLDGKPMYYRALERVRAAQRDQQALRNAR